MAKGSRKSFVAKFAMVAIPLIIAEGAYVLLFSKEEVSTRKAAIENTVDKITTMDERRKVLLKVQLAVSDWTTRYGKAPERLELLQPEYFDLMPVDPKTRKPFSYKVEGGKPIVGFDILGEFTRAGGAATKGKPSDTTQMVTEEPEKVSFVYDPTGKRDPFRPFDLSLKLDRSKKKDLERYDYGQLKLTAVLGGFDEPKAIVENAAGRGFTVSKGTKIGPNGGEVIEIRPDRILILENVVDFTGESKAHTVEMKLRTKDQERTQTHDDE